MQLLTLKKKKKKEKVQYLILTWGKGMRDHLQRDGIPEVLYTDMGRGMWLIANINSISISNI